MSDSDATIWTLVKNIAYIPAAVAGISMESYVALALLLIVDIFTGIWRAVVTDGGQAITSWRALNGFFSKLLFLSVPIVVAFMGHGVGLDFSPMAKMALGVLTLGTGYSVIGNIYTIRTGERVAEYDVLRIILYQIQRILDRYVAPPGHK